MTEEVAGKTQIVERFQMRLGVWDPFVRPVV